MFPRLSRVLAVLALALAPVIGAETVHAASRSAWPVYPSIFSTGCSINGLQMACGPGALIQSQINSGYQCSEIDISENGYGSGPILLTMTANDQSVSQSVSIDGNGTWYVQFPGFLVNNLVSLEFSMSDGAVFILPSITANPCAVATSTPTAAATSTPNPSFTPTATVNPAFTVTPIPTFTPLPSGHSTFTPTRTATPGATSTPTATPGPSYDNCGPLAFPVVNCSLLPHAYAVVGPDFWAGVNSGGSCDSAWGSWAARPVGDTDGAYNAVASLTGTGNQIYVHLVGNFACTWGDTLTIEQNVTVPTGESVYLTMADGVQNTHLQTVEAAVGSNAAVVVGTSEVLLGHVDPGTVTFFLSFLAGGPSGFGGTYTGTMSFRVVTDAPWTPAPTGTATGTPTLAPATATAAAAQTATALAADFTPTAIPIPGAHETPIPTDTECPAGCDVTALTAVPGLSTIVTVDTNPFSPLTHLSLARSSCQPFGYVQIPIPVITGTPALGQPLQFGWTAPITHTWDDTHLITNTAIQPCAMVGEVSPYVWDFTYWGSGVALAIVFTIWLIGWVGRLSGDHTING